MRAEDKERPVIFSLLPALRAMPCAHQRQLSCAFPSVHLGTRLYPVTLPPSPTPSIDRPWQSHKEVLGV